MENKIDEASYKLATRENRLVHFVIDRIVYVILIITAVIPLFKIEDPPTLWPLYILLIMGIVHFLYYTILEFAFQKTLGKYATGAFVVTNTGGKPTFKNIFLRSVYRLIPFAWIIILTDDYSLHDKMSKTRVIKYKS